MNPSEQATWETFLEYVDRARPQLDGCAPVALICVPIDSADPEDGSVNLRLEHADFRVLWPKGFPIDERAPLLRRIADTYERGGVSR